MLDLLKLLGGFAVGLFRLQAAREAEMAFLRQQLLVLKRSAPARLRLRIADRLIFVWLYRLFPSLLGAAVIFQPETLVRWHRSGFRLYWRWKSGRRVGRPAIPAEIRNLVRAVSRDNPLWGAPRIHGELLKLGIDIAQSTVAKYMPRRHRPPSPGWRAFLRSHTAHIAAIDLFVVPTIGFKLLYGLVILRLERRRLVWTNVTANPTAEWIARQIVEAFPWDEAPRYLIRDRVSLLKTSSAACAPAWRWCARLRAANPIRRQDGHKFSPYMQRTVLDQRMDLAIDAARTQWMPASRPPSGSLGRPSISHPFGRPHVIRRSRARSNLAPFGDRLSLVNCLTQAVGEKLGSKKAPPPRRPWSNTSSEIARYCRLGDVETKHQQFTVDAWCAPEHIVSRHTADQVANLGIDSRPTTSPAAPKPW